LLRDKTIGIENDDFNILFLEIGVKNHFSLAFLIDFEPMIIDDVSI
jgi:hypothetical protein